MLFALRLRSADALCTCCNARTRSRCQDIVVETNLLAGSAMTYTSPFVLAITVPVIRTTFAFLRSTVHFVLGVNNECVIGCSWRMVWRRVLEALIVGARLRLFPIRSLAFDHGITTTDVSPSQEHLIILSYTARAVDAENQSCSNHLIYRLAYLVAA